MPIVHPSVPQRATACHSVPMATGINAWGQREVLGIKIGDSETYEGWSEYCRWLKAKGLHRVDLVVSDSHSGLVRAIQEQFQGVSWQRCQAHFTRNVLGAAPKHLQPELHNCLRAIFTAPDAETARFLLNTTIASYQDKAQKAMRILENGFDDATAVLALPQRYRRKLRTTNMVERLNQEIRRRERVIRIFPNEKSALRLIGAFLIERDEDWMTGRKYMDMADYFNWRKAGKAATDCSGKQAAAD